MANPNSPPRNRSRRRRRTDTSYQTLNTGTSRRSRTLRDRSYQHDAEHQRYGQSVQLAGRLHHPVSGQALRAQERGPQESPAPIQPLLGSFIDNDLRRADEDGNEIISTHAEYFRLRRYAEKRDRINQQWSLVETQALATYLLCQQKTKNWTIPAVGFESPIDICTCELTNIHQRPVDLVDILVEKPRSAFSIRLVQYHHLLWKASAVSGSAFIQSLSSYLDNGQRKLFEDGLQLTKHDKWASKCPRCFGPSQNETKANEAEPDVMIAMDGNFQQRHYAYASKDNPREDQYPHSFLPPSKVHLDVAAIEETDESAVGINVLVATKDWSLRCAKGRISSRIHWKDTPNKLGPSSMPVQLTIHHQ
ncbi:hypothetical protein PtB15_11B698 [Puccinia triticina]|nr:hypothetical protein PtB15_11B698 [Puccinia triticina]